MGCATGACTHPLGPTACPVCRWTLESGGGRPAPEEETRRPRNPTRDGVFDPVEASRQAAARRRRRGPEAMRR